MSTNDSNEGLIAAAVASFASRPDVTSDDIVDLVHKLRAEMADSKPAVSEAAPEEAPAAARQASAAQPAIPLSQAVTRERVYCLCCGKGFKMLKRHLGSEHGLTEMQYRRMFDLPEDMPLVAPSYSERKADYAKKSGFGKHERASTDTATGQKEKIPS